MRLCNGKAVVSALVAALALTAGLGASSPARAAEPHFVLISHAPDSDSWWNTIKNAIKQADEDFNVETDYRNPPNGDIADMARLIEQAAARNYDGVITTMVTPRPSRSPSANSSCPIGSSPSARTMAKVSSILVSWRWPRSGCMASRSCA